MIRLAFYLFPLNLPSRTKGCSKNGDCFVFAAFLRALNFDSRIAVAQLPCYVFPLITGAFHSTQQGSLTMPIRGTAFEAAREAAKTKQLSGLATSLSTLSSAIAPQAVDAPKFHPDAICVAEGFPAK
jgi:hypothetical protein